MNYTYRHTLRASYLGYITQAIVVNLASLLFVTFQTTFGFTLEKIGLLISINFGVQIVTDLVASRFIDKVGFRRPVVAAHISAALGLVLLGVLPGVMEPYAGAIIATIFMAIGGGLTEVLISPIVEALPGEEKASAMSLLHSFYSWGQVAVVALSTGFFLLVGRASWRWLPVIWALIPAYNIYLFARVPIRQLVDEAERQPVKKLFTQGIFWLMLILMICSGAAEQAMAQWSSLFAEVALGVDKALGDLLGPCAFAVMMGLTRAFYGVRGARIRLTRALGLSGVLGIGSYMLAVFAPTPLFSLVGCMMTGLAVGLLWPGVLSLSAATNPRGGAAMFAILALAGDVGCTIGPGIVGAVASGVEDGRFALASNLFAGQDIAQMGLKTGLMSAAIFPLLMLLGVLALSALKKRRTQ